jgi:WD40 repeat protein
MRRFELLWLAVALAALPLWADEKPLPRGAIVRLGSNQLRQGGLVTVLQFSPNGKTLLSTGVDGSLRFWDTATGQLRGIVENRPEFRGIYVLRYSPDGKRIATSYIDRAVRIWEIMEGKLRVTAPIGVQGRYLSWSPDSTKIAVGDADKNIRLWDVAQGKVVAEMTGHAGPVLAVGFSEDGSRVLSYSADRTLRHWNAANGRQNLILSFPPDGSREAALQQRHAFSPDGKLFAAGNGDRSGWRLYSTANGKIIRPTSSNILPGIGALAFSTDSRFLATCSGDGVTSVWTAGTVRELRLFPGPGDGVAGFSAPSHVVALSPDGHLLATAFASSIQLWDCRRDRLLFADDRPQAPVHSAVFFDRDSRLVTLHSDSTLHAWDLKTGKHLERLPERCPPQLGVHALPDGKAVRAGQGNFDAVDWQPGNRQEARTILSVGTRVGLGPDGRTLVCNDRNVLRVFDIERQRETCTGPEGPAPFPQPVQFSADGRRLVGRTASDPALRVWDLDTGRTTAVFPAPPVGPSNTSSLVLSQGGRFVVEQGEEVRIWETGSGRQRAHFPRPGLATAAVCTRDGRTLVLGMINGEIISMNLDTGQELCRRTGHSGPVRVVRFTTDETRFVSGGDDTAAIVWDAVPFRADRPKTEKPAQDVLARWWEELGSEDAAKCVPALRGLSDAPAESVAFLRARIEPVKPGRAKEIEKLVVQLDARSFRLREQAGKALVEMGDDVRVPLELALEGAATLDLKRRIQELLTQLGKTPQDRRLRILRSIEALQRAATTEADELLRALASGDPDVWITREAKVALERR